MTAATVSFPQYSAMVDGMKSSFWQEFNTDTAKKNIPQELLNQLVDDKFSGKLSIQNPLDEFVNWQVYFGNGKIHFASSSVGNAKRLNYILPSAGS
ncbi:MAG: hypothetical protein RLZZ490_2306 [Cyanobacteriota bacterium]